MMLTFCLRYILFIALKWYPFIATSEKVIIRNGSWSLSNVSGHQQKMSICCFFLWPVHPSKVLGSKQYKLLSANLKKRGFPGSSAGKESACNAGDPSSTPGSGRSAGKGIDYPLQYSWASLVTQLVKNPPAMQETWVRSLGWEDPLEKGKANYSSILAWRIPWTI